MLTNGADSPQDLLNGVNGPLNFVDPLNGEDASLGFLRMLAGINGSTSLDTSGRSGNSLGASGGASEEHLVIFPAQESSVGVFVSLTHVCST